MGRLSRHWAVPVLATVALCAAAESSTSPAPSTAHSSDTARLIAELKAVGLDPQRTYNVTHLRLRRDAIRLHLRRGRLAFFQPVAGQVTGVVFEGVGDVLVLAPHRVERQQLRRFTESPILTESFTSAYFRFTDDTEAELERQLDNGLGKPAPAPELLDRWQPLLPALNHQHTLRLLMDFLQPENRSIFYGAFAGTRLGSFEAGVDDRRAEPVWVGQLRTLEGRSYYDLWASFKPTGREIELPPGLRATSYRIQATITPTHELEAACEIDFQALLPGQRLVLFELSRFLTVEQLTDAEGRQVQFIQHIGPDADTSSVRRTDFLLAVLPEALTPGEKQTLGFRYRGRVIADVGNGVLYVGARGSWYPSFEKIWPAHYELRFRYPRALELVATGQQRERREDNNWKESWWVTDVPIPVAGFNLGNYETRTVDRSDWQVAVYANRELEPQLAQAVRERPQMPLPTPPAVRRPPWVVDPLPPAPPLPPSAPTALLDRVAAQVADALSFYTQLFGPYPYHQLSVSQIPGRFGQGYPGLLYLSTFSFLPDIDQTRMGLTGRMRDLFSQLVPAHETAHQWWGNWVRIPYYRDQWLAEALAAYSAFLYLEQQPEGPATVRAWLERYRDDLLRKREQGETLDSIGALILGHRLDSSRTPDGFAQLIYSKGPWVLHMLRMALRDPKTGSDEVFLRGLRKLVAHGQTASLTTADFQRLFEAGLPAHADLDRTGRLDWFFEQWVYDTGIPHYRLNWKLRPRGGEEAGYWLEGTIEQTQVPDAFLMPVPVYARFGRRLVRLGSVPVTGAHSEFRFQVKSRPGSVVLDPHQTILCVVH